MTAVLAFRNLLEGGTVLASSADSDFPVENAYDWLTSDFFKPAASGTVLIDLTLPAGQAADYFAFYGHDLYAHGGTVKLQYHDGSNYVDCFADVTPTDNSPQVILFTSRTATLWRVVFTCTSVFAIAVISFGARVELERGMYMGWTPPKFGRATTIIDSNSDDGQFLGRSVIAHGVHSTLEINKASDAWMRANWLEFIARAEQKPFFFLPNSGDHPGESVFAVADSNIPVPTHSAYGHMSVSVPIRGMVE